MFLIPREQNKRKDCAPPFFFFLTLLFTRFSFCIVGVLIVIGESSMCQLPGRGTKQQSAFLFGNLFKECVQRIRRCTWCLWQPFPVRDTGLSSAMMKLMHDHYAYKYLLAGNLLMQPSITIIAARRCANFYFGLASNKKQKPYETGSLYFFRIERVSM